MNYLRSKNNYSAPETYTDLDGNTKSFTIINHDSKAKTITSLAGSKSQNDMEDIHNELKKYRKDLQFSILKEHASLCPPHMRQTFVTTNELGEGLCWKVNAIEDNGVSLDTLRDLHNLVHRRKELFT